MELAFSREARTLLLPLLIRRTKERKWVNAFLELPITQQALIAVCWILANEQDAQGRLSDHSLNFMVEGSLSYRNFRPEKAEVNRIIQEIYRLCLLKDISADESYVFWLPPRVIGALFGLDEPLDWNNILAQDIVQAAMQMKAMERGKVRPNAYRVIAAVIHRTFR